jgi:hypothetical protein
LHQEKQIVEELAMRAQFMVPTLCVQILLAISAIPVRATCLNPPLSAQSISKFKLNPQGLVAPNSDARTIEALTRDIAATDASLASDLVRLAKGAKPQYQTGIAAGLAQAAIACSSMDQHAALLIQQAVAEFQDGQFQASFAAVAGDLSTAATAAATDSATGSVGSVVVTNPNTSSVSTTTPGGADITALVQFTAPRFTVDTPNILASTTANPVSPTR